MPLRVAGQQVEQCRSVSRDILVGREQAEICVLQRSRRVVIAGPQVDVAANDIPLLPHDERELAVRLEVEKSEHDVHAGALQLPRPAHVVGLVKARLQLHECRHVLAVLGRAHERASDRRIAARAVQSLLDGQHVGIGCPRG